MSKYLNDTNKWAMQQSHDKMMIALYDIKILIDDIVHLDNDPMSEARLKMKVA